VASAEASTHEQALAEALARLEAQVEHLKDLRARRIRQATRAGAAGNGAAFAAADLAAVEDALLDLDDDAETEAT
jgi:hypothetical protein